jgi:aspartyl-tRNA(Asn)/glutamyl-tRNA(Gln) amidotransferase subunit B
MSVYDDYEMTIGIECHVQLATKTKLFSPADNDARDAEPNTKTHQIDFGLPGMLPVLNKHAVELAVRAGKALNSPIAHVSRFDRKHYFYPDLPKGYQTSQMYNPIILAGYVDAPVSVPSANGTTSSAVTTADATKYLPSISTIRIRRPK